MAKRFLIVDDSRVSRMIIKSKVASLGVDWELQEAVSGDAALEQALHWQPDFVTMDVSMPGLSGFDAAQRLRELYPQVAVVLLTANVQESSRERANLLGVHFVSKPVTEAAIEQVVRHFQAAA